jgi:hypothetical protein
LVHANEGFFVAYTAVLLPLLLFFAVLNSTYLLFRRLARPNFNFTRQRPRGHPQQINHQLTHILGLDLPGIRIHWNMVVEMGGLKYIVLYNRLQNH